MIILHITTPAEWESGCNSDFYQPAGLAANGFIHACLPNQLLVVLEKWFPGKRDVLIIEIETDLLDSRLIFENLEGGSEQFPHVYGPVTLGAVKAVRTVKFKDKDE